MKNRVLEKIQALLGPFMLPRRVLLKVEGCDGTANAYSGNDAVTVCYEYIDEIWRNVPKETTPEGVAPIDAFVGPLVDVFFHEFGHVVFYMLQVPVFGREEDAADQFSAYLMLNFGYDEARRLIAGTAHQFRRDLKPEVTLKLNDFSDTHGAPAAALLQPAVHRLRCQLRAVRGHRQQAPAAGRARDRLRGRVPRARPRLQDADPPAHRRGARQRGDGAALAARRHDQAAAPPRAGPAVTCRRAQSCRARLRRADLAAIDVGSRRGRIGAMPLRSIAPYIFFTFAQVSRSPTVRLNTGRPGLESRSRQK